MAQTKAHKTVDKFLQEHGDMQQHIKKQEKTIVELNEANLLLIEENNQLKARQIAAPTEERSVATVDAT